MSDTENAAAPSSDGAIPKREADDEPRKESRREDRDSRRDSRRSERDDDRESRRRDRSSDRRRRDRSRSRSRRRDRSRSRSGGRRKRSSGFGAAPSGDGGSEQQSAASKLQQLMVQQQAQQQMFAQMMNVNAMTQGGKKARELYVGNLAIGMVTEQMLRDFFNTALTGLVPEEAHTPAVMNIWMAADMKYSFVECRTPELATSAIALDKVELCGRSLNVGRPSGYVPPPGATPGSMVPAPMANPMVGAMAAMQAANGMAGGMAGMAGMMGGMAGMGGMMGGAPAAPVATTTIALSNMLTVEDISGDEYDEIVEDIREECAKFGQVVRLHIPKPSADGSEVKGLAKAYVKFSSTDAAQKAFNALGGRTFDGKKVEVKFMSEADFDAGKFE